LSLLLEEKTRFYLLITVVAFLFKKGNIGTDQKRACPLDIFQAGSDQGKKLTQLRM